MKIEAFPSGPFQTNAYVVSCLETNIAAIIDPGFESSEEITSYIKHNRLTPDKIIITHSHWDHTADVAELKALYKIPVYIHKLDAPNLITPGADGLPCWIPIKGVEPDYYLEEGDTVSVGNLEFKVIHTPGHSPGGICLYNEKKSALISGDTLFKGTIGNLSFPTANADNMWKSLEKLSILPAETSVYPGHGQTTTIKQESWLPEAKRIFGGYQ